MSKLLKVTLEYEDKTTTIEGAEAEKWERHGISVAMLAHSHGMNPFASDPVEWTIERKEVI